MMIRCPYCSSFVPVHEDAAPSCPDCGKTPRVDTTNAERPSAKRVEPKARVTPTPEPRKVGGSFVRHAKNVALGVSTVVTLMACYGVAYEPPLGCEDDPAEDLDGDGYCREYDCAEGDPAIHDFASDPMGDGIDTNCDGVDGLAGDAG
jgi:hypothetical protein